MLSTLYSVLVLFLLTQPRAGYTASTAALPKCKVAIIGTGPAGLMTAHALLSRNKRQDRKVDYQVSIYESRSDPRKVESGPRAYSLGLNKRGQAAIKYFDGPTKVPGLWSEVRKSGVESDAFWLHVGTNKFQLRKPQPEVPEADRTDDYVPPTVIIPRNKLSGSLINVLDSQNAASVEDSGAVCHVHFHSELEGIDVENKEAVINDSRVPYDLLIGADGVNSAVREALAKQSSSSPSPSSERIVDPQFTSVSDTLPGLFKVMVQPMPAELDPGAVHLLENSKKAGYNLFLIPAPNNNACVLVSWQEKDYVGKEGEDAVPFPIRESVSIEEIQENICENYPTFGKPPGEAIEQLRKQGPSGASSIRCSRCEYTRTYIHACMLVNIHSFP